MSKPIILCEPQCWGFEHAIFNAALLQTVLLAYPQAQVIFMGEREHLDWVRSVMAKVPGSEDQRVVWQSIVIPRLYTGGWRHLGKELAWCRIALRAVSRLEARFLILCSITNTGLLAIKLLMHLRDTKIPVLAVPHSVLNTITAKQPRRPWNWLISFRQMLRFPHPKMLRYVVLGDSICRSLVQILPDLASHISPLDPPYLWFGTRSAYETEAAGVVRFGYFGVSAGKSFDTFFRLASEIPQTALHAEFVMVGFLNDSTDCEVYGQEIQGISCRPLSFEEYAGRADSLTYALGTASPEYYHLTASASFLDALSYGKPGIYLRNSYIEHYFERMGDIGYLCDTYGEMRDLIFSILGDFPVAQYRQQCENIQRERHIFEPRVLASQLRVIVESCGENSLG